jgi:hypothetical protein
MISVALGLLLGAATAAYIVLRPPWIGVPFPNLDGEHTIRPTFPRLAGFLLGRWLGSIALGALAGGLGRVFFNGGLERVPLSINILLSCFLLLLLTTGYSPELSLARATDPSPLHLSTFWLGLLSAATLLSPLAMGLLQAGMLHSAWRGSVFFTNMFLGNALICLPFFLNIQWVRKRTFQFLVRMLMFFCALSVLFLSVSKLLKT